jgi:2',3'-cyclic-nucleotide 2'-phosphodiesterase (5'-nucleotidase family)
MIIDTGSELSLIKESCVPTLARNNLIQASRLISITGHQIQLLGNVKLYTKITGYEGMIEYVVCDNNLDIAAQGLIGLRFLAQAKANLNLAQNILSINDKHSHLEVRPLKKLEEKEVENTLKTQHIVRTADVIKKRRNTSN